MSKKNRTNYGVTGQDVLISRTTIDQVIRSRIKRRTSLINTDRMDHIYHDRTRGIRFTLHHGDLTDSSSHPDRRGSAPDEIYNLRTEPCRVSSRSQNTPQIPTAMAAAHSRSSADPGLEKKSRVLSASTSELTVSYRKHRRKELRRLSTLALCRCQALRLLDHRQLSRGLRNLRLQRHPVSITSRRCRERRLSRAKSPAHWRASSSACRNRVHLGNLDAKRDWATLAIMSKCSG